MKFRLFLVSVFSLAAFACDLPPSQLAESGRQAFDKEDDQDMRGFSWVIDRELAALPRPGGSHDLDKDLDFLADQGVSLLVSLTIQPTSAEKLRAHGIDQLHLPVEDFTAPSFEQMREFIAAVDARHADGLAVGVHCTAGLGRSGTMLAAYFVSQGMSAVDAIAEIRRLRPGSVETLDQEAAIAAFAELLVAEPQVLIE